MTGDILTVLLAALTLLASFGIGYFFFRLAAKEPRPVWVATSSTVVRADVERDIEVRFAGEDVPVVARTVVALWNSGRGPIRRVDLVDTHPLCIQFPQEAVILKAQVVAMTRQEIDFTCSVDHQGSLVTLDFSHLNYRDGASVEVLHTSPSPALAVNGAIVGVNGPPTPIQALWDDSGGSMRWLVGAGIAIVIAVYGVRTSTWLYIILGLAAAAILMPLALSNWRKAGRRVPAALRDSLAPDSPGGPG